MNNTTNVTFGELKRAMHPLKQQIPRRSSLVCHPENLQLLRDECESQGGYLHPPQLSSVASVEVFGILIHSNPYCPKTESQPTGKVLFPKDRFVEYGPEDEEWALKTGFAKPEMEDGPVFYEIDDTSWDAISPYRPPSLPLPVPKKRFFGIEDFHNSTNARRMANE